MFTVLSPIIPYGEYVLSSYTENDRVGCKQVISQCITAKELKNIPNGYGGRIGIIPFFQKDGEMIMVLNRSNRGLLSDFGGGVRADKTPYEGLVKELSEEVPFWANTLLQQLESDSTTIHTLEVFYPLNEKRSKQLIRTWIIAFVEMGEEILQDFSETPEVKELVYIESNSFVEFLEGNQQLLNAGLNTLLKYYYN